MKQIAEDFLQDCSTPDEFRFSLRCAECGYLWTSEPVPFSKAGVRPETEGKRVIYQALYAREKARAFQAAAGAAANAFSLCPICGRLVCDRCFLVCDDLDICVACAGRLKERGEPVAG